MTSPLISFAQNFSYAPFFFCILSLLSRNPKTSYVAFLKLVAFPLMALRVEITHSFAFYTLWCYTFDMTLSRHRKVDSAKAAYFLSFKPMILSTHALEKKDGVLLTSFSQRLNTPF